MSELIESIPWQRLAALTGEYGQAVALALAAWIIAVQRGTLRAMRAENPTEQSLADRLVKSMRDCPDDWAVANGALTHAPTGTSLSVGTAGLLKPAELKPFGWGERRRLRREMLGVLARHVERRPAPGGTWTVNVTGPNAAAALAAAQAQATAPNAGKVPKV